MFAAIYRGNLYNLSFRNLISRFGGDMGAFLLTSDSTLMCPHGGIVTWSPVTYTSYRVSGRPPLLLGDSFVISGCPFMIGTQPSSCVRAEWYTGSSMLIIKGRPVLTSTSTGICVGITGTPHGPVIIAAHQIGEREPDEITIVND